MDRVIKQQGRPLIALGPLLQHSAWKPFSIGHKHSGTLLVASIYFSIPLSMAGLWSKALCPCGQLEQNIHWSFLGNKAVEPWALTVHSHLHFVKVKVQDLAWQWSHLGPRLREAILTDQQLSHEGEACLAEKPHSKTEESTAFWIRWILVLFYLITQQVFLTDLIYIGPIYTFKCLVSQ